MPDPNPAAMEFLLTRRSRPAKTLGLPVPDRAELMRILTAASRSPEAKAGSAAGRRRNSSVRARSARMVRARSSRPGSVRLNPSRKAEATGK